MSLTITPHLVPPTTRAKTPVRRSSTEARKQRLLREIGSEAPIDSGAPSPALAQRTRVSLRWLGASVLTGIAGILLLGSAIYVSSDGEMTFAELPERASPAGSRSGDESGGQSRKGDKLVRAEVVAAAKQTFRAPMTLRTGDREVIKVRSFARISTGLSMTAGAYATDIPPFNPLRFFADAGGDRVADAPPETSDAEVSVTKSDLSTLSVEPGPASLTDEQVAVQVREEARLRAAGTARPQLPLPATFLLARTLSSPVAPGPVQSLLAGGADSLLRSIEVRVVPENLASFPKAVGRNGEAGFVDRMVAIRRGDTLESVLRANGALPDDIRSIASILVSRDRATASLEGMQLRVLVAPPARVGEVGRLVRAVLISERGVEAIAAANDRGAFVSITPQVEAKADPARPAKDENEDDDEGSGVTLYQSLYETALKQDLSRQTVEDLVRIFGYDVDFQRHVSPGDTFELFYANDEESSADRLEILSAALTVGSEVHRVYRYQGDDGTVDYFDEAGRSLKKFLIRKPVVEARMSSGFGVRYHPILGYAKMHTGVDWAAKMGTPILAAGNGTIIKAEMSSGYGRRTEIQHANGYVTAYNHQSAFARGIAPGAKVRQGQVIGFVGSSGLSTGAHVHYEVIVNGHFVDPMKIRVPRGRELDGRALTEFGRQRDQIEQLQQKSAGPNRLAQTEAR